ncbi:hypothetical protein Tsubulata_017337, partial [Turnera subulata]
GEVPISFCNLTSLRARELELSDNNLTGKLPHCLGNASSFNIDGRASSYPEAYPKVESWNVEGGEGDCCSWDGVECDNITAHITALDLSSSCLSGSIHSDSTLFQLVRLQYLDLADNDFQGSPIPFGLVHLSKLTHLNLSISHFSGQIPPNISDLFHLLSLDLSWNVNLVLKIPNFNTLVKNLASLQILHLDYVDISSEVPHILANSSSLSSLSLEGCNLRGEFPTGILQLPTLEFLLLDGNENLRGQLPEFHSSNHPLKELSIWSCNFCGQIPPSLGNLTQLVSIDLSNNSFSSVQTSQLSWIAKLTKLTGLGLADSNLIVNDFSLKINASSNSFIIDRRASGHPEAYPKVESWNVEGGEGGDCCSWDGVECDNIAGHVIGLDLSSSCLSGSIDSHSTLFQLVHLQYLDLADNDFQESPIPSGLGHLSKLTHLNLYGSHFSAQIPSNISDLFHLLSLDLSANDHLVLKNPDFNTLVKNLVSLEVLHLDSVDISSEVPHILANSSSLTSLSLFHCRLRGEFPTGILQLPTLEFLQLGNNRNLRGHLPEFHPRSPLRKLSIWICNFSGPIPSSLGNLTQLVSTDISYNSFSAQSTSQLSWIAKLAKLTEAGDIIYVAVKLMLELLLSNAFMSMFSNHPMPAYLLSPTTSASASFATPHPRCHDYESAALLQFKESFTIDMRASSDSEAYPKVESWNVEGGEGDDCCSWDGVECDNITAHVIALDLGSSCLSGSIDSHSTLFQLVHLQYLDLSDNDFQGSPIPSGLGHLSKLTHLDLSFSTFSGQIPSNISDLFHLLFLDLSENDNLVLKNPDFNALVMNLASLQLLHLDSVDISSEVPHFLANSSSLTSLSLVQCRLRGEFPAGILQLPTLEFLHLDGNENLRGQLPEFHSSNHPLRELTILGCNFYGEIPPSLGNLTQLVSIDLSFNSFSTLHTSKLSWIAKQSKLTGLRLGACNLIGEFPSSVSNLTNLSALNLEKNQLTGPFPPWLVNLTELTVLRVPSNDLQGIMPDSFSRLKNLQIINLSFNNFTGPVELDMFLTLEKLHHLGLSGNNFSLKINASANGWR